MNKCDVVCNVEYVLANIGVDFRLASLIGILAEAAIRAKEKIQELEKRVTDLESRKNDVVEPIDS